MKNKCKECGKELSYFSTTLTCYDCEQKENIKLVKFFGVVLFVLVVVFIGGKFLFAKVMYDDYKCAFANCRIIKD